MDQRPPVPHPGQEAGVTAEGKSKRKMAKKGMPFPFAFFLFFFG
jgi:hypothetical protein